MFDVWRGRGNPLSNYLAVGATRGRYRGPGIVVDGAWGIGVGSGASGSDHDRGHRGIGRGIGGHRGRTTIIN